MDEVTRIRSNYFAQKERYERTARIIAEVKARIESDQKRVEALEAQLPQYKQWYENSKRQFDKIGNSQKQARLSQMQKTRDELERLSGEKVVVKALDELRGASPAS